MTVGAYTSSHSVKENPVDTGSKLNVLCTFNLRPVSTGKVSYLDLYSVTQALFSSRIPNNDFTDGDDSMCH